MCPNGKKLRQFFAFVSDINKINNSEIINMFLIPKNNLKNFDPERCCFVLNEFSAAEFASALEMLFAAKNIDDINAKTIISAAGCWTKELLNDIPVVPQKHTVFRIKCPLHIPEMPLTGDLTTGVYWRPEGKEYLAGSPKSIFDAEDLEPAWNDFEELVWPALAKRIPAFEELKLTGGWAGYYDCNKLDNNAVVGKHPKYENVYLASGFTGRGLMQAPGIGRALTELITTGSYQSIDISCFDVERVLDKNARPEPYVL